MGFSQEKEIYPTERLIYSRVYHCLIGRAKDEQHSPQSRSIQSSCKITKPGDFRDKPCSLLRHHNDQAEFASEY